MKIMCLNGWGGTLYEALAAYVGATAPDILCLQEVVHSPLAAKDWLTYRDGDHILPQRANFFRDVCRALPDHVGTFCPAAQGVLWDGEVAVPSQWGLATFVHRRLPVIGQLQDFVHKGYGATGYGDHPRSRSAHALRVYDHARERAVSVAHMHGLRDLRGKMDTPERDAQAHRFCALAERMTEPGDLKVMCGDFNVEPDSRTLAHFKARGFTELVTAGGFPGTRNTQYRKPGRFADYMLIDRPDAVVRFDVVFDPEVSDHCPLVLEV